MSSQLLVCPICRTGIFLQAEMDELGNLKFMCLGGHEFELRKKEVIYECEMNKDASDL
ncbi:MAG: hypothetical protein PHQ67_03985 [Fermentimonas sp.]|nr:hypothetical protein [Fermentimonas sp.]MDD4804726.1 hypothetical protein [Candidatus Paceibacterota bacterium]